MFEAKTEAVWIIKNRLTSSMKTHQEWAEYLSNNVVRAGITDVAGDIKHHRKCIEGYQGALEELESLQKELLKGDK